MKKTTTLLTLSALLSLPTQAVVYAIDINDEDNPVTPAGWTGLSAGHTTGSPDFDPQGSVTVGGITFSLGSSDGARNRGATSPNSLTGDFAFDDGAGQAIILFFGGAGDLAAGDWMVEVWSHDSIAGGTGDQILGYRTNNTETEVTQTMNDTVGSETVPSFTFTFTSDGVSAYDVFVRENNGNDRSRLNAVRLTSLPIPEPSSALLTLLGAGFLLRRRR